MMEAELRVEEVVNEPGVGRALHGDSVQVEVQKGPDKAFLNENSMG